MRFAEWWNSVFIADPNAEDAVQIDPSPPPKPRLVAVRRAPGRDEWNSWRDNPVTEFVMASLARNADEYADEWHRLSWVEGKCDPMALETLRARSDILRGIAEADYEAFCEVLGLEPEEPPHAA